MLNYKKEVSKIIKRTKKEILTSFNIFELIRLKIDSKKYPYDNAISKAENFYRCAIDSFICSKYYHLDGWNHLYPILRIYFEEMKAGGGNKYRRILARLNCLQPIYCTHVNKHIDFIKGY